jgi:alpha-glucosidase
MSRQPERRAAPDPWWRSGVLYQVYPRSFADADGDGHGDLQGVIDHLDHLAWLGIDGLWLNPVMPSPNADWGYDVSDYTSVHPDFGDLATLDRLVSAAGDLGIHVILDLVPNHTSDRHPWFLDARGDRSSPMRDRYVWADPGSDGGPPNNSTNRPVSTTCTTSWRNSPTSTGGTTTCATRSTTSRDSGSTAGSRGSGSTSRTAS